MFSFRSSQFSYCFFRKLQQKSKCVYPSNDFRTNGINFVIFDPGEHIVTLHAGKKNRISQFPRNRLICHSVADSYSQFDLIRRTFWFTAPHSTVNLKKHDGFYNCCVPYLPGGILLCMDDWQHTTHARLIQQQCKKTYMYTSRVL